MLVHILVAALAQTTLAVIPDMVVVRAEREPIIFNFLIPNHARRGILSLLRRERGKHHSFYVDHTTYDFNCKAGFASECRCSMEAKSTLDETSPVTKTKCFGLKVPRDVNGRCLVQFRPPPKNIWKTPASCRIFAPIEDYQLSTTLQTVSLRTFLVPKQEVAWAFLVGKKNMVIKCGMKDTCDCSMMPLHVNEETKEHACSSLVPKSRDINGHCVVSYSVLSSGAISCKTLGDDEVAKSRREFFTFANEGIAAYKRATKTYDIQDKSIRFLKKTLSNLAGNEHSEDAADEFIYSLTLLFNAYKLWATEQLDAMDIILKELKVPNNLLWKGKISTLKEETSKLDSSHSDEIESDLKVIEKMSMKVNEQLVKLVSTVKDELKNFVESPVFHEKLDKNLNEIWKGIVLNQKNELDSLKPKA